MTAVRRPGWFLADSLPRTEWTLPVPPPRSRHGLSPFLLRTMVRLASLREAFLPGGRVPKVLTPPGRTARPSHGWLQLARGPARIRIALWAWPGSVRDNRHIWPRKQKALRRPGSAPLPRPAPLQDHRRR